MASSQIAAMLDELMGRNRNVAPHENVRELVWSDPEICRYFLVDFCPHDLFTNTKADLGPCGKIHDEDLKQKFTLEKETHYKKSQIVEEFLRFCQRMLTELQTRIRKAKERLLLTQQQEESLALSNAAAAANGPHKDTEDKINLITERINQLVEEAEASGCEGNVEKAQGLMKLSDQLRDEREYLKRSIAPFYGKDDFNAQQKAMEVCDTCGAFLIVGDAQQRIDDHLMGKQHIGYAKLRSAVDALLEERKKAREEREKEMEERRKKREEEAIKRKREKSQEEERQKKEESKRSRKRSSRSRERDHRRKRSRSKDRSADRDRRKRSRSKDRRRSRSRDRKRSRSRERRRSSRDRNSNSRRRSRSRDRRRDSRASRRSRSRDRNRSRDRDRNSQRRKREEDEKKSRDKSSKSKDKSSSSTSSSSRDKEDRSSRRKNSSTPESKSPKDAETSKPADSEEKDAASPAGTSKDDSLETKKNGEVLPNDATESELPKAEEEPHQNGGHNEDATNATSES